ncbi:MAG: hypothetical protein CL916_10415 [Deltaproteobacteria bacterium]|nr:hypothetical protein [Deltaproteobacteria bacterium]
MKKIAKIILCGGLILFAIPVFYLLFVIWVESSYEPIATQEGVLIDAARISSAEDMRVVSLSKNREEVISSIQQALVLAKESNRSITIGGARHSMGGQTLLDKSIHIDMDGFSDMNMEGPRTLRVQSGVRWRDVVAFLHERDLSVSVMQTNHDFSVGGSISVNAHGWQHGKGPIASTVQAFDMIRADGSVVHCSRTENSELFALALGGYGLFGVILDVWLDVVPNERLQSVHRRVDLDDFVQEWLTLANDENTQMLYGRLRIVPYRLFEDVLITGYTPIELDKPFPKLGTVPLDGLKRAVFRGSEDNSFGKRLRWSLESMIGGEASGIHLRSILQNEPASTYANRNPAKTDVLHEYFVPADQLVDFVRDSAQVISSCDVDLLNVTIRSVQKDVDTVLRYANEDVFALVLLFTYDVHPQADELMRSCTVRLVDKVLEHRGTFYLPYRTHPTLVQFQQAYPKHKEFWTQKQKYDPQGIFESQFSRYYFP